MNNPTQTKRCGACQQVKGHTAFVRDPSRSDGLRGYCRACHNQRRRARYANPTPEPDPTPQPAPAVCTNCQAGRHGTGCAAAIFGPACACGCRAVLGLDGPFEFPDPTAPDGHRYEEAS